MKPRCVFVLGMHRSGTSALTRVLNLMGARLSRDLIASKPSNITGFWEAERVLDINNLLLKQFNLLWRDDLPLPAGWLDHPAAREARREIDAYLQAEFADCPLFAIKDPRLCRVLPLWLEAVEARGAEAVCLICYRHPIEVAASLDRRDGIPRETSLHLWMRSYLEAERDSRGRPRLILAYDDLLEDWRSAVGRMGEGLQLRWSTPLAEAAPRIDEFISPTHRHHTASEFDVIADPELRSAVRGMYERLGAMSADPAADWAGADRPVRHLLEARERLYGELLRFEHASYFEERDDKRRLKRYSQRLRDKLGENKQRTLRLKLKWKLILAVALPLAFLLGLGLGRLLSPE